MLSIAIKADVSCKVVIATHIECSFSTTAAQWFKVECILQMNSFQNVISSDNFHKVEIQMNSKLNGWH